MSRFNLRRKQRISYYEPEEPNLDEYVWAGLGIFSTLTLPRGVRFGPYQGKRSDEITSTYCWQLYDAKGKRGGVIDAVDANSSNWMRYVNCARHWCEQNLIAYQYQGQIYYRTIKIIPKFTELMVFYGSEFANLLGVDLRKYNSPAGYAAKYGAPPAKKNKLTHTITQEQAVEEKKIQEESNEIEKTEKPNSTPNTYSAETSKVDNSVQDLNYNESEYSNIKKTDNITTNIRNYICNDCGKMFNDKSILSKHMEHHNVIKTPVLKSLEMPTKINKTSEFNERYTNKNLNGHSITRSSKKTFECEICYKKFTHKGSLKLHLRTHTGEKPFECEICKKRFNLKGNLTTHLRTHTGEKPFECEICKKRFNQKCDLTKHLRTHTGEKPFECEICKKRFIQKICLTIHLRTHSGEKPFECEICKKRFILKISLTIHLRTHTGEKPFECEICKKRFNQKCDLTKHLRTHTGEKPFECEICKKRFIQKICLTIHLKTHSGEKPFECEICKKRFNQKGNLTTHLRTHAGQKTLQCTVQY